MQKITTTAELRNTIYQLELKQEMQEKKLRDQFYITYDSFRAVNLFKKVMIEIITAPGLVSSIIKTVAELVGNHSSKQAEKESENGTIKNIIRSLVKFGITKLVIENPDNIKLFGQYIVDRFIKKKPKEEKEEE